MLVTLILLAHSYFYTAYEVLVMLYFVFDRS